MAAKKPRRSSKLKVSETREAASWTDLIGFDAAWLEWRTLHKARALPQVLLVCGREGLGKSSLALGIAALAYCDTGDACGSCQGCTAILKFQHAEVFVADPQAPSLKVDDAALIQEHLTLLPNRLSYSEKWFQGPGQTQSASRTVVITDIERMTVQAANRLLKTLEEPADHVRFILTTSRPEGLLPTIRSRCVMWHLRPPAVDMSRKWLQNHAQVKPEWPIDEALRLAGLAPGKALALLEQADTGTLGLMKRLEALLFPPSIGEALATAQEIGRSEAIGANTIAEAAELVLNQHYRMLVSGQKRSERRIAPSRYSAWRRIIADVKAISGNGKVPLAKQLVAEALALA